MIARSDRWAKIGLDSAQYVPEPAHVRVGSHQLSLSMRVPRGVVMHRRCVSNRWVPVAATKGATYDYATYAL
jgi:hypothetical protein